MSRPFFFGVLLAASLPGVTALARQVPPDSTGPVPITVVATDSSRWTDPSSRATSPTESARTGPTPRGALIRGALIPGWGHVYIHRYGRLPFVYGALGGLVFTSVWLSGEYGTYRRAYQYKTYQDRVDSGLLEENPRAAYEEDYSKVAADIGAVSASVLKGQRNTLRRNRDLTILATGVVWALSVLDAYVSAHLLDFDVSEDLSVRAAAPVTGPGIGAVIRLRLGSGTR